MTITMITKKVTPILKSSGVLKASIFGSAVRGKLKKRSDIDFLIKLPKRKSLLDMVALKFEMEDRLGRKIDIVSYGGINPLLKDTILKEQKVIYERKKRSKNIS